MLLFIYLFLLYTTNISSADGVVQNIYWREYIFGDIPCDAYEGAPGRYIGQVNYNGFNLPATIYTSSGEAIAAFSGKRTTKVDIKILCSPDNAKFYWEYVDFDKLQGTQLQDVIKGGFQGSDHNQLFIGKILHEEEWRIGKVHGYEYKGDRGLWIWNNNDQHVHIRKFYVLKYNYTSACSNYSSKCGSV